MADHFAETFNSISSSCTNGQGLPCHSRIGYSIQACILSTVPDLGIAKIAAPPSGLPRGQHQSVHAMHSTYAIKCSGEVLASCPWAEFEAFAYRRHVRNREAATR